MVVMLGAPGYERCRRIVGPPLRTLYGMQARGQEHVPLEGPLVVAANHVSMLDPFALAVAIPRSLRYLGKDELWRIRPLVPFLEGVGAIPVARGRSDVAAVASALAALERGEAVGIFPEGGVRRHGPWRRGAARMAIATGSPLLPVRLLGTAEALSPGRLGLPRLAALIGEPIAVPRAEPTPEAARELTDRLQAAVLALGT